MKQGTSDQRLERRYAAPVGRAVWRVLAAEYRLALQVDDITEEWVAHVLACAFCGPCGGCGRSVDVSGSPEDHLCGGCIESETEGDARPIEGVLR